MQAQEHALWLQTLLLQLRVLLCTALGKPQSGAGTTCGVPTLSPWAPRQLWWGLACTGQTCLGIAQALEACVC